MSSKNNKISVFSSISSSYYDHNYYSLYLKLKDFTDTSLPSKLLDEVQTIKKAVTDIQSSIESNYDGSTVQLTIDNLEAMIRNLSEKETFISDKLIPAFKLIPKLRKLLIKKYSISSTKNNDTYYDSYIEDFDSSEEGVLTSLASSIDTLSDSLGYEDYISEEYSTSSKYDKEIESVIKKIRKLLKDDDPRRYLIENEGSINKVDEYESYYEDYDTVDAVGVLENISDEDVFDYMESTSTNGAFKDKLKKKAKKSSKKKSSSKDFSFVEVDPSSSAIRKKSSKNKSGTYVDAYNVKDFDSAEVEDNYKTLLKKNTTKYYKSD